MVPFLALFEFYDDHLLNLCKMLIRSIAKVAVFLSDVFNLHEDHEPLDRLP